LSVAAAPYQAFCRLVNHFGKFCGKFIWFGRSALGVRFSR
jgi:hypothetical protein